MSDIFFFESDRVDTHIRTMRELVENARAEVFVVSWPNSVPADPPQALDGERRRYFDTLLRRCREDGLRYTRIVQVGGGAEGVQEAIAQGFDRLYLEHFRDVLRARQELADTVDLRIAPLTLPGTFAVIDGEYLAWEICEIADANGPAWRSRHSMQIHDAAGDGVRQFGAMLGRLFPDDRSRAMTEGDLGNHAASLRALCSRQSAAYNPFIASSESCVPVSTIFPRART